MLRGIFQKTDSGIIFRISKPGKDATSTDQRDFLLHETHLYTQPYFFGFVACPFAGSTSSSAQVATVQVTVPGYDANPLAVVYPLTSGSTTCFPSQKAVGPGSNEHGWEVDIWSVYHRVISSTRIDITFDKPNNSKRAPQGCYLMLMRNPS